MISDPVAELVLETALSESRTYLDILDPSKRADEIRYTRYDLGLPENTQDVVNLFLRKTGPTEWFRF